MSTPSSTDRLPAIDPSTVSSTRTALLSTARHLVSTSGNQYDGYLDGLIPLRQGALHQGQTLHDLEEGNHSITRPVPERILAQEHLASEEDLSGPAPSPAAEIVGIAGVIFPVMTGRERMFVKWKGKSILRASWVDASLWKELQRGHRVREEWQWTKFLIRKGSERAFDMEDWEGRVRRDEEIRWERRKLALLRRQLMESVGVLTAMAEDEDRNLPGGLEERLRREEVEEKRERDKAQLRGKKRGRDV